MPAHSPNGSDTVDYSLGDRRLQRHAAEFSQCGHKGAWLTRPSYDVAVNDWALFPIDFLSSGQKKKSSTTSR